MSNPDIPGFENSVDPDQLASKKPADQDPHCFHSACKYMLQIKRIKNWKECSRYKKSAGQGLTFIMSNLAITGFENSVESGSTRFSSLLIDTCIL